MTATGTGHRHILAASDDAPAMGAIFDGVRRDAGYRVSIPTRAAANLAEVKNLRLDPILLDCPRGAGGAGWSRPRQDAAATELWIGDVSGVASRAGDLAVMGVTVVITHRV